MTNPHRSFLVAGAVSLGLAVSLAFSVEAEPLKLETYLDMESVRGAEISPDGEDVIYTRRRVDKMNDKYASMLWIVGTDGSRNRELIKGGGAKWSPDGTRIAYIAADADKKPQIFVRWMDAEGAVSQVTHSQHPPRGLIWSPDGNSIAFVSRVDAATDFTVKLPGRPKGAKWTDDPVVIETLHYRQDRVGIINDGYDHLFVVPAEGGTPRQITEGNWNVGARGLGAIAGGTRLSWSPDGSNIAFDALIVDDPELRFFESGIHTVDIASGDINHITRGAGNYTSPKYSPDGSMLAFAGYEARDRAYPVPSLWVSSADGWDEKRAIAADMDDGPNAITWAADGKSIYFGMGSRGSRNLYSATLSGRVSEVTTGAQIIGLSSVSDRGQAVITRSTSQRPGDIYTFNIRNGRGMTQLTHVNDDVLAGVDLGAVEEINYLSTENTEVQGWIITPPDFDASKKYPLVLQIHGGPHGMYGVGFSYSFQEYAAAGYVVLYTNPRGSTGYGNDFANAIQNAYPGIRDYSDLMAGVDTVIARGYIDESRMFVTGCSGGGVLTTWVVGQTDRFAAAVARCPVVDWIGFAGTADVTGWVTGLFDPPYWEDPGPWLEHSPLMHVGNVKTPVLLMTGDKDMRTPIGEAEKYFSALKHLGVPTKLLPMHNEYHGTGSIPSNFMRTQLFTRKWFDMFAPAEEEQEPEAEPNAP